MLALDASLSAELMSSAGGSFCVRLASFFCARRSAFSRCFSNLFISF